MKKFLTALLSVLFVCCMAGFIGCHVDNNPGPEAPQTTQLEKPALSLQGNVVSWVAVPHATSYDVTVNTDPVQNVTVTSYTVNKTEAGTYTVKVVAKSTDQNYTASEAATINYVVSTSGEPGPGPQTNDLTDLVFKSAPTKTTYYLDERVSAQNIDLAGLAVDAKYADGTTKPITDLAKYLSFEGVDMSTTGDKQIPFKYSEGGVEKSLTIRITLKQRTEAEITEYQTVVNEFAEDAEGYDVVSGAAEIIDLTGKVITKSAQDKTQVAGSVFASSGYIFVRVEQGEQVSFIKLIAAIYIQDEAGFAAMKDDLNGYYILKNDITFTQKMTSIGTLPLETDGDNGDYIKPDGTYQAGVPFTGTFDGNGFTLIDYANGDESGRVYGSSIFDYVGKTGVVKDFKIKNFNINSKQDGSIISSYNEGLISGVTVMSGTLYIHYRRGGAFACVNCGTIKDCISYVTQATTRNDALILKEVSGSTDYSYATMNDTGIIENCTIIEPYPTELTEVVTQNIKINKGAQLDLSSIDITATLVNGMAGTVHPTAVEGLDVNNATEQSVQFVWADENGHSCKIGGTVTVLNVTDNLHVSALQDVTEVLIPFANGDWKAENVDWSKYVSVTNNAQEDVTEYTVSVKGALYGDQVEFTFAKADFAEAAITLKSMLGIDSAEAFLAIVNDLSGHYKITKDIDFTQNATESANLVKGTFAGILEGGYNKLTGISINTEAGNAGIFTHNSGAIKEIIFMGSLKSTSGYSGFICCENSGTIENCYIQGTVEVNQGGGFVNKNLAKGTVSNCVFAGSVTASAGGGIMRKNEGTVANNLFIYEATGVQAGYNSENEGCNTAQGITAKAKAEVVADDYKAFAAQIQSALSVYLAGGSAVTELTAQLKEGVTEAVIPYAGGWDIQNVTDWSQYITLTADGQEVADMGGVAASAAKAYGKTTVTFTYQGANAQLELTLYYGISNAASYAAVTDLAAWYMLTEDITLTDPAKPIGTAPVYTDSADETHFGTDPQGTGQKIEGAPFTGEFNGNGKKVTGLKIGSDYTGEGFSHAHVGMAMFGYVGEGAKVYNIVIDGAEIKGCTNSAFIAGWNKGEISNVTVNENCKITAKYSSAAAFVGQNDGKLTDNICFVTTFENFGAEGTPVSLQGAKIVGGTYEKNYIFSTKMSMDGTVALTVKYFGVKPDGVEDFATYATTWGPTADNSDEGGLKISWVGYEANTYNWTISFTSSAHSTCTAGDTFDLGFRVHTGFEYAIIHVTVVASRPTE